MNDSSAKQANERGGISESDEENTSAFEVLDAQRKALEEMSDALVAKLFVMVKEQDERAREFAERTHSLSSLPQEIRERGEKVVVAAPNDVKTIGGEEKVRTGEATAARKVQVPLPVTRRFEPPPDEVAYHPVRQEPSTEKTQEKKGNEITSGKLLVVLCILFVIILRACT